MVCDIALRESTPRGSNENPGFVQRSPTVTTHVSVVQIDAVTFGEHGFPNLTGSSLAKTRRIGLKTDRSVQSNYLSFLRNVCYIVDHCDFATEIWHYRRILAMSCASSSEKIGTAFDLCMVPMPLMADPV